MAGYRVIVADPPWPIGASSRGGVGGRRRRPVELPYQMLPLGDIVALPVADLAADDCWLFLWSTRAIFREGTAASVCRAWGYRPCGELIWGLPNPGMGGNDHEPVLIGRRGSPQPLPAQLFGVYFWRQARARDGGKLHSVKPDGFLDLLELLPGPYLELFARRQRFGWDTWGDEAREDVTLCP